MDKQKIQIYTCARELHDSENLHDLLETYEALGWARLEIIIERGSSTIGAYLWGYRWETDEEWAARVEREYQIAGG